MPHTIIDHARWRDLKLVRCADPALPEDRPAPSPAAAHPGLGTGSTTAEDYRMVTMPEDPIDVRGPDDDDRGAVAARLTSHVGAGHLGFPDPRGLRLRPPAGP